MTPRSTDLRAVARGARRCVCTRCLPRGCPLGVTGTEAGASR